MNKLDARAIHSLIGGRWPAILAQLGIDEACLKGKHCPCPACGGTDRFRFTNWQNRGSFICGVGGNGCGTGDGFELLMRVHSWNFAEARKRVIEIAGLGEAAPAVVVPLRPTNPEPRVCAVPTARVLRIRKQSCSISSADDAVRYLAGRAIWPLPDGCTLRAHPALDYWLKDEGRCLGRFPALLADVRDVHNELVTLHVTYLQNGAKLAGHEPRKILSVMDGRIGCAIRLMPLNGDALGIAEGIETALSAAALHDLPVWATANASLLGKFEPPSDVRRLVIFADRDLAGSLAMASLMERLQGRVRMEIALPPQPHKDWNNALLARPADPDSILPHEAQR